MRIKTIDNGQEFDWGNVSSDYASYRDIYPASLYEKLSLFGIARKGKRHLDIGTGTGVVPLHMHGYGATITGIDISIQQIEAAKRLSRKLGLDIEWKSCPAENTGLSSGMFATVSAVQCWQYFDREKVLMEIQRVIRNSGLFALGFMGWLPKEDHLTKKSLQLVSKYSPQWRSHGNDRHRFVLPRWLPDHFRLETYHTYDENIPFTHESWTGRLRACRGVGASLSEEKIRAFSEEHMVMLKNESIPHEFTIPHQIVIYIYRIEERKS